MLAHRILLTRALTVPYQLAVERGKWHGISREWVYIGCVQATLKTSHVFCSHARTPPADVIRRSFLLSVWDQCPSMKTRARSPSHPFLPLVWTDDLAAGIGRFVHEISTLWVSVPLLFYHLPTAEVVKKYLRGGLTIVAERRYGSVL